MVRLGGDRVNVEELVEYVAAEVLKRIKESLQEDQKQVKKKKALLIGKDDEIFSKTKEALELEYIVETSSVYSDYNLEGDYDYVVLSSVDTDLLANVAMGLIGEKYPVIHKALMQGTPIDIVEEGLAHRKYVATCNANFYALVLGYEEKVQSFGMGIKPVAKLTKVQKQVVEAPVTQKPVQKPAQEPANKSTKEPATIIDRKLITEQHLRNEFLKGNTQVNVSQGAIITPLAVDYAREQNISIVKM